MSISTDVTPERAILVGIDRGQRDWSVEESLAELENLTLTAGATVVGVVSQRMVSPNPRTFIGPGKADEVARMADALDAQLVIFDDELTPSQQSNLEHILRRCKVIDRTALILDIFALHATTREGRLQVRLAQNEYLYPRLRGMWAHLASNRMGGGVGSRFGEGESQLEVDRRIVRKRISSIKHELAHLSATRKTQRKSRSLSLNYRIALAGYTNAGKSSLINRLTGADVLAYDKLFATLDSTTRKLPLPNGREATLTDTVGFIQKLPTNLVEAFKSTLDEISEADLILQVTDASSPQRTPQMHAVEEVLGQIDASGIPRILVFNKCDLLDETELSALRSRHPAAACVSAKTGMGITELLDRIVMAQAADTTLLSVAIPYTRGDLLTLAHEHCIVVSETYEADGTHLQIRVPDALRSRFSGFEIPAER
jgi:GTP-binding protein HflX